MKLDRRLVGAALIGGVALIIVGVIAGRPTVSLAVAGAGLSDGSVQSTTVQMGTGLFDPADGNLWIGAGIAVLFATAIAVGLASSGRDLTHPRAAAVGALFAAGWALIVAGLIVGRPTLTVADRYLSGLVNGGKSPPHSAFVQTGTGLFDPADGNLWIGAGVAVLVLTGALLLRIRSADDRTLPGLPT